MIKDKKNTRSFSVVIIGRNCERSITRCIDSLRKAFLHLPFQIEIQYIYVDSKSSDRSLEIALSKKVEIIKIVNGFISAAAGRHIGLIHCKYDNIVFVDSDMEVRLDWFSKSLSKYYQYGAIVGDRHELIYNCKGEVVKEIEKFYKFDKEKIVYRIGGFLMINRNLIIKNYNPWLRNEEESDFYARFVLNTYVYALPFTAYTHHNYEMGKKKIIDYFMPESKNGYIKSFINSIKNRYFIGYCITQGHYLFLMLSSLFLYSSFLYWPFLLISIFLMFFSKKNRSIGGILTVLFFPYKLIGLILCSFEKKIEYIYNELLYMIIYNSFDPASSESLPRKRISIK